jgi:hypothetical protein
MIELRTMPDKARPGRVARSGFLLNEGAGIVGRYWGRQAYVHGELTTSLRQNIVADIGGVRYEGLHFLNQKIARLCIAKPRAPKYTQKSPRFLTLKPGQTWSGSQRGKHASEHNS